jgi:large subunit ribosomal protein L23
MIETEKILRGFWLTEKSNYLSASRNQYVFRVALDATREQVGQAIRREFGVVPLRINLLRHKGKLRSLRTMGRPAVAVRGADEKKAFVALHKDEKIEIL